jgi:RHS repeat-associated protein
VDGSGDFRYDSLYRLRGATGRQAAGLTAEHDGVVAAPPLERYEERYEFDHSGNLTRTDHLAELGWSRVVAIAASANHGVPVAQADGRSPDDFFDPGGNLTELPSGALLGYDHIGRMTSAALAGATTRCQYDHTGMRVRRVVDADETLYVDDLVVERGEPDRVTLRVVFGGQLAALLELGQDGAAPVAARRFQLSDRLGSVAYELDGDGNILTCEEYLPFGGSALLLGRPEEVATKRYRYTGKELDPTTGLYDHGRRYYLPGQGRWTTPDPAGEVDGLNLFAYVRGNPVTVADPTGEAGDENEPSTKPLKKTNYFLTVVNALADAAIHFHWEPPIERVMRSARAGAVFPFTRAAAFGGVGGGLSGSTYYALDIRSHGANFFNVTSLVGNLAFMVEGGLLYRSLMLSGHALHAAHITIGRVGMVADFAKVPKALKDKDYVSAVMYTALGLANARAGMSDQQVANLAGRLGPRLAPGLAINPGALLIGVVGIAMARAVAPYVSRDHNAGRPQNPPSKH